MAARKHTDYSGIEISARTSGPAGARTLTVYIEAPNSYLIEESAIGRANVLAHKRGFSHMEGVERGEIVQSTWSGMWQQKVEYTQRWRGRSSLDRKVAR